MANTWRRLAIGVCDLSDALLCVVSLNGVLVAILTLYLPPEPCVAPYNFLRDVMVTNIHTDATSSKNFLHCILSHAVQG